MSQRAQVEHLFRHEYGKLVALLVRRYGIEQVDTIEDSVQWAMTQALELWCKRGTPDNPTGWLYRVADRNLVSELRTNKRQSRLLVEQYVSDPPSMVEQEDVPLAGEMADSLLRMLFAACDSQIPVESQLVFTLKTLCGFNIREIASRMFLSEANTYKRFNRARQYLKNSLIKIDELTDLKMNERLSSVHRVLYLVFTEGYLSSHADMAIRYEFCEEAIRLMSVLKDCSVGSKPETSALLALMYLHLARINGRQDNTGMLLQLEQQDRSLWDRQQIAIGLAFLEQSTHGDTISRYHIEAGIAAEHCLALSFKQTRWDKIVASYELLEQVAPSPLHLLNRAIAVAEWKGPQAGLDILRTSSFPDWLNRSYHWYAVLSDLYFRCGESIQGHQNAEQAIALAPSQKIKQLLNKRLLSRY